MQIISIIYFAFFLRKGNWELIKYQQLSSSNQNLSSSQIKNE